MFRRALLAALPALALFSVSVSAKQLNECLPIDRALSTAEETHRIILYVLGRSA